MPDEIGSYDAKTKLPEILRRVEAGEAFTITKRGKPIADLVPSKARTRANTKSAIDNLLKMAKHKMTDRELQDLIAQGRK